MKTILVALLVSLTAASAHAAPVISGDFLFTENRGPNPVLSSGHKLVLGATNITPSGAGTSAQATHVPAGSGPDFALPFVPTPVFPNQYATVKAYGGETGQWDIAATDGSGTTVKRTHLLDDVQLLPLLTGGKASGPRLTPHLTWDPVDPAAFPSFCHTPGFPGPGQPCQLGTDFYNYQISIRIIVPSVGNPARTVFNSNAIPTTNPATSLPTPTVFDVPAGVLQEDQDYLLEFRLLHADLEQIILNPDGSINRFVSPLENRSAAYLPHTTPAPSTWLLTAAGVLVAWIAAGPRRT